VTAIKKESVQGLGIVRARVRAIVKHNKTPGIQLQLGVFGRHFCYLLLLIQDFLHDFGIKVLEYKAFRYKFLEVAVKFRARKHVAPDTVQFITWNRQRAPA